MSDPLLIALALAVPTLAGWLVAAFIRVLGADQAIGNTVGAGVILVIALLLFAREFVELARMHEACSAAGRYCPAFPGDINRYALIGLIAFVDIGAMYMVNLGFEERRRRRGQTPA